MKYLLDDSIDSGSLILPTNENFFNIVDLSKTLAKISGNQTFSHNENKKSNALTKIIGTPDH